MKKHKIIFIHSKFVVFLLGLLLFLIAGCKSTEISHSEVDSLLLLDNKGSFYLRIPTSVDENLVPRILQNSIKGLDEKNAALVASKIDVVYAGITRGKKSTEIQIAADCNFPSVIVKKAFSTKNGWKSEKIAFNPNEKKSISYSIYNNGEFFISFPSSSIVCAGREVSEMVKKYHKYSFNLSDDASNPNSNDKTGSEISSDVYKFLFYDKQSSDKSIKFYATRPQAFLPMLIGSTLNFNLVYARGEIFPSKKGNDQIELNLEMEFKNSKVVPVGRGAVSLAFGLTDSDVELETPTHLVVKNIKISREQLYKILVL